MGYWLTQLQRLGEFVGVGSGAFLTFSLSGISFLGFPVANLFGAYAVAIARREGLSVPLAILATVAVAGIVGFAYARMYRRLSPDAFAVFSLASLLAADALVRSWDSVTGGVLGISVSRPDFARSVTDLLLVESVFAICVIALLGLILRSPLGRSLRALRESPTVLDSLGTDAKSAGSAAIFLACVLAAVAGMFAAWRLQFVDPGFANVITLVQGLTIAILSLRPRLRWFLGATVFTTLLPEVLRFFALPSALVGHARVMMYAMTLLILLLVMSRHAPRATRLV